MKSFRWKRLSLTDCCCWISFHAYSTLLCLDRFPPVIGIVIIVGLAVLFAYGYYQFKSVVGGMGSAKAKHNLTSLNNLFYRFFCLAIIVLIMIILCTYLFKHCFACIRLPSRWNVLCPSPTPTHVPALELQVQKTVMITGSLPLTPPPRARLVLFTPPHTHHTNTISAHTTHARITRICNAPTLLPRFSHPLSSFLLLLFSQTSSFPARPYAESRPPPLCVLRSPSSSSPPRS